MDFSKHPVYGADYVSAVLLALALTILFASALREQNDRGSQQPFGKLWILALASWISGIVLIWLGEIIARWLPFAIGVICLAIIVFQVVRAAGLKPAHAANRARLSAKSRAGIAIYFAVTLLLFLALIFARSYITTIT